MNGKRHACPPPAFIYSSRLRLHKHRHTHRTSQIPKAFCGRNQFPNQQQEQTAAPPGRYRRRATVGVHPWKSSVVCGSAASLGSRCRVLRTELKASAHLDTLPHGRIQEAKFYSGFEPP
ncbi:hypothetical protein CCMA1212_004003 [Trichoderma ghanense]|uniref:Uncharacterized protein n=1 Tax=Trichoderma ghanense TaxID=65468 RepID=A0ABY2HAM6_9HYPO